MNQQQRAATLRGWKTVITAHPVISGVFIGCISIGAVLGVFLLTDDWSAARRIAAGAVGSAGVSLLIALPRIIG